MATLPTIAVLEQFISQNDPFTRARMMHTLGISAEEAERSIKNLLDLGVIRLLDPDGARSYYTGAVAKQRGEPCRDLNPGGRQGAAAQPVDATETQRGIMAPSADECIRSILSALDSFSKDDAAKLGVLYAAEREILSKRRGRE